MSWYPFSQSNKSRKKNVVGITSRASESNFLWLKYFVMKECSDLFELKYLPITNDNRCKWEKEVGTCSAIILYHTSLQGRVNVTDVDGALYDNELRYLSTTLGREKVVVLLDDMGDISEEERQRILRTQKSLDRLSSHLILIPEKNKSEVARRKLTEFRTALSEDMKTSQQKDSPGVLSSITSIFSRSSGDTEHSDSKNNGKGERAWHTSFSTCGKSLALFNPSQSPPRPYRIGIFSRSVESNYKWLADSLKTDDSMRSLDIKSVYISNDYKTFSSGLETCRFAILYHSRKQGRLNITNVTDSLYDTELRDMSGFLGRENVIVVADDLKSSGPEDKEQILRNQPSIYTFAEDLFLFTEHEKHTRNVETIRQIIRRSQAKHNGPDKEYQAAPPRERESSMKTHGYSVDSHKTRITPDQVSTENSSPSRSESLDGQITSQKSDIAEPQPKRSKTLSSEQTNSMDKQCDLPDAPPPDLLSAPNKKWNDSQQEKREPRKVVLSQEEKIKELENSHNSLTLEKNRAVEKMKKIIQKEERNIDGNGEEIGERENLVQQRETNGKEIGMYVSPQEGEDGAHGHETLPQGRERFPEKGHHLKEHLQKTEGSSCLENQSMDELITKMQEIMNEKNRKLQRQSEEIKSCHYFLSKCKCQE